MELKNSLYFGDCLDVLRELSAQHPQGFVDLIYLDPPFNSKRDYNLLFKSPKGGDAEAQITAFADSWHWGMQAEKEFDELFNQANTEVAEMMRALRGFLGENDMMAYLTFMANRLLIMFRVLKDGGSMYLHCDSTASHYLRIVLDAVFEPRNYRNEIIWLRSTDTGSSKAIAKRFPTNSDTILVYSRGVAKCFNPVYSSYSDKYLSRFKYEDERGRYRWQCLKTYSEETFSSLLSQDRIRKGANAKYPEYKQYVWELKGVSVSNVWTDINQINPASNERLGYPTQKPLALLQRIIKASSNEGDVILDPFCGCGTAVHAAQSLNRKWIGIDITHLAINLIEQRIQSAFRGEAEYQVFGTPRDFEGAAELARRDKYQFQLWACSLVKAQGNRKGPDGGIDGLIFFRDDKKEIKKIIVSVKGGSNIGRSMISTLIADTDREKASIGLFVTLTPPTRKMVEEAAAAGFYESPHHGKFPKIQILTIEGLMNGTERPQYMDLSTGITFKQAKREIKIDAEQDELFDTEVE